MQGVMSARGVPRRAALPARVLLPAGFAIHGIKSGAEGWLHSPLLLTAQHCRGPGALAQDVGAVGQRRRRGKRPAAAAVDGAAAGCGRRLLVSSSSRASAGARKQGERAADAHAEVHAAAPRSHVLVAHGREVVAAVDVAPGRGGGGQWVGLRKCALAAETKHAATAVAAHEAEAPQRRAYGGQGRASPLTSPTTAAAAPRRRPRGRGARPWGCGAAAASAKTCARCVRRSAHTNGRAATLRQRSALRSPPALLGALTKHPGPN